MNRLVSININECDESEAISSHVELTVRVLKAVINTNRWIDKLPKEVKRSFTTWTTEECKNNAYIMSEWEFKLAAEKDNWIFIDKKVTDSSIQFVIKHNPMSNYIDLLYLLMVYNIDYRKVYVEDGMFGNYWLKDTNIKS